MSTNPSDIRNQQQIEFGKELMGGVAVVAELRRAQRRLAEKIDFLLIEFVVEFYSVALVAVLSREKRLFLKLGDRARRMRTSLHLAFEVGDLPSMIARLEGDTRVFKRILIPMSSAEPSAGLAPEQREDAQALGSQPYGRLKELVRRAEAIFAESK